MSDQTLQMSALWAHDADRVKVLPGLAGVDEAGRGALAGPVVAAAVYCPADFFLDSRRATEAAAINDSKKLSREARRQLRDRLLHWRGRGWLCCAWAESSVAEIAEHNILGATRLAMARALAGLEIRLQTADEDLPLFQQETGSTYPRVLLDGPAQKSFPYVHEGLVQGDSRSFAIAAASILAKVHRDERMEAYCQEYPAYGFSRHRGYGSRQHREALLAKGACPLHRALFLRKIFEKSGGKIAHSG